MRMPEGMTEAEAMGLLDNLPVTKDDCVPKEDDVRAILADAKELTEHIVDGKAKGIVPMMLVRCLDIFTGKTQMRLHCMDIGFESQLDKKKTMKLLAALIYEAKLVPLAIGMVSEAWESNPPEGMSWEDYRKKYLMIADDPNRYEVAIVSACGPHTDKGQIAFMDTRKMKRASDNAMLWAGEWNNRDKPGPDGKMATVDVYILDRFFGAYADFAFKRESHKPWLEIAKTIQVSGDQDAADH